VLLTQAVGLGFVRSPLWGSVTNLVRSGVAQSLRSSNSAVLNMVNIEHLSNTQAKNRGVIPLGAELLRATI